LIPEKFLETYSGRFEAMNSSHRMENYFAIHRRE